MAKFQQLQKVDAPDGAVAVLTQAHSKKTLLMPRYMTAGFTANSKKQRLVPAQSAGQWMRPLFNAYMSLRCVMYAEQASDILSLHDGENVELCRAASRIPSEDGSAEARTVGVTLLVHGHCSTGMASRTALDALSHMASSPLQDGHTLSASLVRFSVLASADAEWFVQKVHQQALASTSSRSYSSIEIAVRWAQVGGDLRTEFFEIDVSQTGDKILASIQTSMLRCKAEFGAPVNDAIFVHHPNVQLDAYIVNESRHSHAFFALMEGTPFVSKSVALSSVGQDVGVSSTNVFVRIHPRARGEKGAFESSAFHGVVLSLSSKVSEATAECLMYPSGFPDPSTELGAAFLEKNSRICMHTCAVQATQLRLGNEVTLFAPGGIPGQPIRSPGSWMWRFDTAIVPIENVLAQFEVVPCSKESTTPGNKALEHPFRDFFQRASKLYTCTFGDDRQLLGRAAIENGTVLSKLPDTQKPEVGADEIFLQTAFSIDPASRRTTVGDAYASLKALGGPSEMVDLMLQVGIRYGTNTTMLQMVSHCANAVRAHAGSATAFASEQESQRLKRVADAALLIGLSTKRSRTKEHGTFSSNKLRGLMNAAGISTSNNYAKFPTKGSPYDEYAEIVQLLSSVVVSAEPSSQVLQHAAAEAAKHHANGLLNALGAAVCVLRASNAIVCSLFLLVHKANKEEAECHMILPSGSSKNCSPGAVLDSPRRKVLLLKTSADGAAKLIGTKLV